MTTSSSPAPGFVAGIRSRILRSIWNQITTYVGLVWLWLLGITIATVTGINLVAIKLPAEQVIVTTLLAFFCTGVVFKARVRGWIAVSATTVLGVGYLLLVWGNVWTPTWHIVEALWSALQQYSADNLGTADVLAVQDGLLTANRALLVVLFRFRNWFLALGNSRVNVFDPMMVHLAWGLGIWLAIGFLNWATWRRNQAILAILPLGVLLTIGIFFTGAGYSHLVGFLFFTLLLQSALRGMKRVNFWKTEKIDFAGDLFVDTNAFVISFIGLIIGVSVVAPSISFQKIADTLYQMFSINTRQVNQAASSLGLEPMAAVSKGRLSSGLPQSHLLGNNPNLGKLLVMTIQTGELAAMPSDVMDSVDVPRHYWQAMAYSRYDSRGWFFSDAEGGTVGAFEPLNVPPGPGKQVTQVVRRGPNSDDLLYTSGIPLSVDHDVNVIYGVDGALAAANLPEESYLAESWLVDSSPSRLRSAGTDYPAQIESTYLQLPSRIPDRVRNLALQLTAQYSNPYDKAAAIESYLRTFTYNLKVKKPPEFRDVADYFLFDLQEGYCDYYATSMVVLARAAGIPARFVIGYAPGNYDSMQAKYRVTEADAHSWAQVYFPGVGWVDFEPTAGRPAIVRVDVGNVAESNLNDRPPVDVSINQPETTEFVVHPFWWAVAILGAIYIVVNASIWRMRRMPVQDLSRILYHRLLLQAERTGFEVVSGYTPYEFSAAFVSHLQQQLDQTAFSSRNAVPHLSAVHKIASLFVQQLYAPPLSASVQRKTLIDVWLSIRFQLWWAIILLWLNKRLPAGKNRKTSPTPS